MQWLWNTVKGFLKKLKIRVNMWSSSPTPGHMSGKDENVNASKEINTLP